MAGTFIIKREASITLKEKLIQFKNQKAKGTGLAGD